MADSKKNDAIKSTMRFHRVMEHLFDPDSTDVEFQIVEEGKEAADVIRAHKKLLSAVSPVFRTMFDGNWNEVDTVKIIDADHDVFNEFVQYLYGDEVAVCEDNFETLLYLAKKYDIGDLLPSCSAFIAEHLSVDNVAHSLNLAITYDLDGLKEKCKQIISEKTLEVLRTDEFFRCDNDTLAMILQLEQISCTEAQVFDACFEWAKRKCQDENIETNVDNLLKMLGKCFDLLRFKEMDVDDFIQRSKLYNGKLFKRNDLHNLMVHFVEKKNSVSNKRQRQVPAPEQEPIEIYFRPTPTTGTLSKIPGKVECTIKFSISKPLLFIGFDHSNVFLETTDGNIPSTFHKKCQLRKCGQNIMQHSNDITVDHKLMYSSFADSNRKIIESGKIYEFQVTFTPKIQKYDSFMYVFNEIKSQTLEGVELTIHPNGQSSVDETIFIGGIQFEKFSSFDGLL